MRKYLALRCVPWGEAGYLAKPRQAHSEAPGGRARVGGCVEKQSCAVVTDNGLALASFAGGLLRSGTRVRSPGASASSSKVSFKLLADEI